MEYNRTRMSHEEHEAMRENRLEEIDLSAGSQEGYERNDKIKDEILPHSGSEEQKGNRGRGVLRKGRERETART